MSLSECHSSLFSNSIFKDYYQCQAGGSTATPTSTVVTTTKTSTTSAPGSTAGKFKYVGVNQSGAEFGSSAWPGTLGKDYIWPAPSSIDVCTLLPTQLLQFTLSAVFRWPRFQYLPNHFPHGATEPSFVFSFLPRSSRVTFFNIASTGLTGAFDATYLSGLKTVGFWHLLLNLRLNHNLRSFRM